MAQQDLRTYRRRGVTRESGYHTCDETTGGECIIKKACRYVCKNEKEVFVFKRSSLELTELFEKGISMIAFGGYIHSDSKAVVSLDMDYAYEGQGYAIGDGIEQTVEEGGYAQNEQNVEDVAADYVADGQIEFALASRLNGGHEFRQGSAAGHNGQTDQCLGKSEAFGDIGGTVHDEISSEFDGDDAAYDIEDRLPHRQNPVFLRGLLKLIVMLREPGLPGFCCGPDGVDDVEHKGNAQNSAREAADTHAFVTHDHQAGGAEYTDGKVPAQNPVVHVQRKNQCAGAQNNDKVEQVRACHVADGQFIVPLQ